MSVHLFGKREIKRLGSVANDGAGAGYTTFAKSMMAKMGWKEGQGLGKDMQGRSTYVQVKKKDDNTGLGTDKAHQDNVNDQWYFNAFDSALANMTDTKKKKKKKKDKRRERENRDDEVTGTGCMYDKMFKATGGARMGMRARAAQNGKLARTEGGRDVAVVGDAKKDGVPTADQSREERRKRERAKRAREADGEEIDAAPADEGNGSQQNTAQMKSSGKMLRENVETTESDDGDVDGTMAETIVVSTDTKTRKRDKLGGKKGNRVDESMGVVSAVDQDTRKAVGETPATAAGVKERKKKKRARSGKGSQQAVTES